MSSPQAHAERSQRPKHTICVLCLLSIVVLGCRPASPTPEPVTISFAHPATETAYYEALGAQFSQDHPQITIRLEAKSIVELDDIANITGSDAFVVYPQTQLADLLGQEALLDLASMIEQDADVDLSDMHPDAVELCTVDGHIVVVPASIDLVVMYYNLDLFDNYAVPYPEIGWTWEDLRERAVALRDRDAEVYGYGSEAFLALLVVYQHGGQIVDDWRNPSRTTFDDPLVIEAVQWYADLIHKHEAASPLQAFRSPQEGWLYAKVAMAAFTVSERGGPSGSGWAQEWPMRWGMVPLPRDQLPATLATLEGYGISSETDHPDACWQWVKYLSQQMPLRSIPIRSVIRESAAYREQVGPEVAAVVQAAMAEDAVLVFVQNQELLARFIQSVVPVLAGQATAQEALLQAQQQSPLK